MNNLIINFNNMLNSQFNELLINQDNKILTLSKWLVEFDWLSLTSISENKVWFMIKTSDHFDLNNIDIWDFISSISDWWWVYNRKYWNKDFSIKLFIQATNYDDLINKIDSKVFVWFFLLTWFERICISTKSNIYIKLFNKVA